MAQPNLAVAVATLAWVAVVPDKSIAQVVPDATLGAEASAIQNQVIQGTPSQVVTGGAQRGSALFHSFSSFNIGVGQGVYFANPLTTTDIIGRVTGSQASFINGILGVLGSANLILINPHGINFGATAQLNLRGSFLASTATQVDFPSFSFDALNPNIPPILVNTVPTGLGFARPPAAIKVEGAGHTLNFASAPLQPTFNNPVAGAGQSGTGLRVDPGRTLALVGGAVSLNGGVLTAPGGNIKIGGVSGGSVQINPAGVGWNIDYNNTASTATLEFSTRSLLDVSGLGGGQIFVKGGDVSIRDGSYFLNQNQGLRSSSPILVEANNLTVAGTGFDTRQSTLNELSTKSGILSITFEGKGADIILNTTTLNLNNAGGIRTLTYGSGSGGNIQIESREATTITGVSPLDRLFSISLIQALTFFTGKGGDISLSTKDLSIGTEAQGGMNITASSFGLDPFSGTGGNVAINAQKIQVAGSSRFIPSTISTTSSNNRSPGAVQIRTTRLEILAGAVVGSNTLTSGSSGSLNVQADDIFISGQGNLFNSGLGTPTVANEPLNQLLNISTRSSIDGGNTRVRTNTLRIENSGIISVLNDGKGNAGNLDITANRIEWLCCMIQKRDGLGLERA